MNYIPTSTLDIQFHPSYAPRSRQAQRSNPVPRVFFYSALALVFIRFSMLHQILSYVTGVNSYLLYFFGLPCIVGIFATGGLRRAFRHRPTLYWLLFALWMVLAAPFSSWRGDSAHIAANYLRTELPMLFIIAGLVVTWQECKLVLYTIAAASILNILSSRIFGQVDEGQRLSLSVGSVANSNDFAAHLLIVLPFLFFVVLRSRSRILRLIAVTSCAAGVYVIISTASRGGCVGLVSEMVLGFFLVSSRHRIYIAVGGSILLAVCTLALPERTIQRILSVSANKSAQSQEALESEESRRYLLKTSIRYTFEHPLFGVGPGQFRYYEGAESTRQGRLGNWHEPHNAFTKASSECGIPALAFYLAAVVSTMKLLAIPAAARSKDMRAAVLCMRLAIVGYSVAIAFLNLTYFFYLPAMTGIALVMANASSSYPMRKEPKAQDHFDRHFERPF